MPVYAIVYGTRGLRDHLSPLSDGVKPGSSWLIRARAAPFSLSLVLLLSSLNPSLLRIVFSLLYML